MIFTRKKRQVVYESDWMDLYLDHIVSEDGHEIEEYHVVHHKSKSVCVVIENKEKVLFVKAKRYLINNFSWELPAGKIEEGENSLAAAQRELKEETGYTATHLKKIYTYMPSNSMHDQEIDICTGKLESDACDVFDETEIKQTQWFSWQEIVEMIHSNAISDGVTLLGLLMYNNLQTNGQ